MPANFNIAAIQALMQEIGARIKADITLVLTTLPMEKIPNLGIKKVTPTSEKGPVGPTTIPEVNLYVTFQNPPRSGLWIGSMVEGQRVEFNMTGINLAMAGSPTSNADVTFANILFHEVFYHGILGNAHIPGWVFEKTGLGKSEASMSQLLRLTGQETRRINDTLLGTFSSLFGGFN